MAISSSTSDKAAAPAGGWWSEARAVFVKDVRSELRTRAALATILLFAFVTLIIVSMCVRTTASELMMERVPNAAELLRQDPHAVIDRGILGTGELRASLLSALLWITLFFSAMMGLPRTFLKEEEMRTAPALRLAARPEAVFAGKLLFNLALVLAVALLVFPVFLILYVPLVADWPFLIAQVVLGSLAMAGSATILGAIVARAGGRAYLMLPLAFPVVLPVLVLSINGTANAITGKGGNHLIPLVSYLVAMVTVSALLFEQVWNDA